MTAPQHPEVLQQGTTLSAQSSIFTLERLGSSVTRPVSMFCQDPSSQSLHALRAGSKPLQRIMKERESRQVKDTKSLNLQLQLPGLEALYGYAS